MYGELIKLGLTTNEAEDFNRLLNKAADNINKKHVMWGIYLGSPELDLESLIYALYDYGK